MLAKNYWFDRARPKGLAFARGAFPVGFTGKKDRKHYHKGRLWTGHTGFLGREDWPNLYRAQT